MSEISELLILPLTVTSSRKLSRVTACPRFAAPGFSDEGESGVARAGAAKNVGRDGSLSAGAKVAQGPGAVRASRRPAVRQWRRAHGHRAQQNPERFRGEIANHARQTCAL